MKLSTKIILPIILISALLILLTGCFGVPDDESPGYTPGTITGTIAAPCCDTSAAQVTAPSGVSPEFWCYYCVKTWYLQDGVEVVLTYDGEEVDTTVTNENGQYTFTDVPPGKNYVITAYCPDYDDERPLVKDVALELTGDGSFDAKITDLVSTSLGLVVDFLVDFTILGPEDIVLDDVIADKPEFPNFPKFEILVGEVRRVLGLCRDVNTDDDLQYALCRAAEEISGLTIGCGPGYTYTPPQACAGNIAPVVDSLTPLAATVGTEYSGTAVAHDANVGDTLTFSLVGTVPTGMIINGSTGAISGWTPVCADIPSVNVIVKVTDNCKASDQDTFTITVSSTNYAPVITSTPGTSAVVGDLYTYQIIATDTDCWSDITYTLEDGPASMTITDDTISWTPTCADIDLNDHSVTVRATDNGSPVLYKDQTFDITVSSTNYAPVITSTPGTSAVVGDLYTYQIIATDTDCWPIVTYSLESGPATMTITDDTISWTPTCADSGINSVTVRATDNGSPALYDEQTFDITVPECGPCELSDLSLKIKTGSEYTEKIAHPFEPTIMVYNIKEPQNASMFNLEAVATYGKISYRYWRGSCAGNAWTSWSTPVSNTLTVTGLKICNNEVNTLEVKVDCGSGGSTVYTVNIVPREN